MFPILFILEIKIKTSEFVVIQILNISMLLSAYS